MADAVIRPVNPVAPKRMIRPASSPEFDPVLVMATR
jgi:hypothetical protein